MSRDEPVVADDSMDGTAAVGQLQTGRLSGVRDQRGQVNEAVVSSRRSGDDDDHTAGREQRDTPGQDSGHALDKPDPAAGHGPAPHRRGSRRRGEHQVDLT